VAASRAALALAAAALLAASPAARAEDPADLARLEQQRRDEQARAAALQAEAAKLGAETAKLQLKLVAAARTVQDQEDRIAALTAQLATLAERQAAGEQDLARHRKELAHTLAALELLAVQPPQALLLSAEAPVDSVRAALLLRSAVPAIEARAAALRRELAGLAETRAAVARQQAALASATAALETEQAAMADLLRQKQILQQSAQGEAEDAAARAAALGRQARDLRDLLARLKADEMAARAKEALAAVRPAPPAPPTPPATPAASAPQATDPYVPQAAAPAAEPAALTAPAAPARLAKPPGLRNLGARAAGQLTQPVRGSVVARFGDAEDAVESKGLIIATRPGAQVVAPFDGQVKFQGPFRGYGEILIIEHGGGYHSLLAGLAHADAVVGQWLLAGEPVGVMGPAGSNGNPKLYLELRRDGLPIDPSPWLGSPDPKKD
jgi:septal ring factor EnvC (AmiA/AmiB activator)